MEENISNSENISTPFKKPSKIKENILLVYLTCRTN